MCRKNDLFKEFDLTSDLPVTPYWPQKKSRVKYIYVGENKMADKKIENITDEDAFEIAINLKEKLDRLGQGWAFNNYWGGDSALEFAYEGPLPPKIIKKIFDEELAPLITLPYELERNLHDHKSHSIIFSEKEKNTMKVVFRVDFIEEDDYRFTFISDVEEELLNEK